MGWGSLEIAGRISTKGSDNAGPRLLNSSNPRPAGIGTFQETSWGGIFLNAFVDTVSRGMLLEASYAAELAVKPVTVYPQVGLGCRSSRYTNHLYGVSVANAAAAALPAYVPGTSIVSMIGLSGELPISSRWVIVSHVQREAFDRAINASPRVDRSSRISALIALAY